MYLYYCVTVIPNYYRNPRLDRFKARRFTLRDMGRVTVGSLKAFSCIWRRCLQNSQNSISRVKFARTICLTASDTGGLNSLRLIRLKVFSPSVNNRKKIEINGTVWLRCTSCFADNIAFYEEKTEAGGLENIRICKTQFSNLKVITEPKTPRL